MSVRHAVPPIVRTHPQDPARVGARFQYEAGGMRYYFATRIGARSHRRRMLRKLASAGEPVA